MRRVISEQTSQQMREVLTRVVAPGGTGFKAFCAEWPIGGKTGINLPSGKNLGLSFLPASGNLPLAIQTANAYHDQVDIPIR